MGGIFVIRPVVQWRSMKNGNLQIKLSMVVLLVTSIACGLSGEGTPIPVTDTDTLATFIAGTAQVAASQTAQAAPNTPTSSPAELLTPTPKISAVGTSLILNEDQSTTFIDHKAGIQLVIPPGWLSVRPNEEEYTRAFSLGAVAASQEILNQMTNIQSKDANLFRLNAIDIREGHVVRGIVSYIDIIFEEGDVRSREELEQEERTRARLVSNFKVNSSSYPQTANGTTVLVVEESWAATPEIIYYRGVFFSLPTGTLVLGFYSNILAHDSILPDFEQVMNSVTLFNP